MLCKLSENLGPSDQADVYGTLDGTAIGSSANITPLGSVYGNQGDTGNPLTTRLWPYLFAQRITGTSTGTFFVTGATAVGLTTAPGSVALPALNAFSTAIDLTNFGSGFPVRVGLDGNATASDVFNVYGTNDPSFVGTAGGELINKIIGGGSNNNGSVLLQNFQYAYVQRVSGATAGNLLAWGADDSGAGPPGPPGPQGPQGAALAIAGLDGEDGEDGYSIPGLPGLPGPQGAALAIAGLDGEDGEDGYAIPGPGSSAPQRVYGVAQTTSTTQTSAVTLSVFDFNPSTSHTVTAVAVMQCATVSDTITLQLYDLTTATLITTLTNSVPTIVPTMFTAVLTGLVAADHLYYWAYYRTGGVSSDAVTVHNAYLLVS